MDREQFLCEGIVRALRQGLVPTHGLERIAVGREDERQQLRRALAFSKYGGSWVRFVTGNYGTGKTFLCSWLREEAWKEGFVVAAVDLGRNAPFHRFEVIYQHIMEALRTDHFRELPALEFILQEWLSNLEKEVQRSRGLNPWKREHGPQITTVVEEYIDQQLTNLGIHDPSFGKALRRYYTAAQSNNDVIATAVADWFKGAPLVAAELRQKLDVRGGVAEANAFNFLRMMAALLVHIGYAGLVTIFDEFELIRGIARAESRHAAYENIRRLLDWTAQEDFAHCGFMFAGSDDLLSDEIRGLPSYASLYERLQQPSGESQAKEVHQPLLQLARWPRSNFSEVARKVREVHGTAYGWKSDQRLTDDVLSRFIKALAVHFGAAFNTVLRGFLKVLVDVLDELLHYPHVAVSEVISMTNYADRIEDVERQEAHLFDSR